MTWCIKTRRRASYLHDECWDEHEDGADSIYFLHTVQWLTFLCLLSEVIIHCNNRKATRSFYEHINILLQKTMKDYLKHVKSMFIAKYLTKINMILSKIFMKDNKHRVRLNLRSCIVGTSVLIYLVPDRIFPCM